jgi:hypothetical protein
MVQTGTHLRSCGTHRLWRHQRFADANTPQQCTGSASCGDYDGEGDLDAVVPVRFLGLQDLRRRLDMHHDELNGQRGRLQAATNFMGDFMTTPHGQFTVHFHVEFHKQAQAALAGPTFLNAHDAWHRDRDDPDFFFAAARAPRRPWCRLARLGRCDSR